MPTSLQHRRMASLGQMNRPSLNVIPVSDTACQPLSRENGVGAQCRDTSHGIATLLATTCALCIFFEPEFSSVSFCCFALNTSIIFSYFTFSIIDLNIHPKDLTQLKSSVYVCSTSLYKQRGWARLSQRHWIVWNRILFIWTSSLALLFCQSLFWLCNN